MRKYKDGMRLTGNSIGLRRSTNTRNFLRQDWSRTPWARSPLQRIHFTHRLLDRRAAHLSGLARQREPPHSFRLGSR
jgi:hypothetical protein